MSSHNRNPKGKNQYASVPGADDPKLREALERYHREFCTDPKLIVPRLKKELGIEIGASTVKRRRIEMGIMGSRVTNRNMPYQEKVQLIIEELDKDPSRGRGLDNIRACIAFNCGIHLTRDFVSDIMHTQDAEGFLLREPTSKKIPRTKKSPVGIHERWSGDGHDKLNNIGFPIWAVVDDATSKWLGAWVVPSNRLGTIIGYLYLCLIEEYGGMPLQFTTDCGSETTQAFGFGNALRYKFLHPVNPFLSYKPLFDSRAFQPNLDPEELPAHVYVRSVHNISIERSWLCLRLEWGNNAVLVFQRGISANYYNPNNKDQFELCQWLWPRMLQKELDQFMAFRNGVRMRKDAQKAGPSGCSRNEAFCLPERWGGIDCLQPVDIEVIREMKAAMGGDALLSFVSLEFAQ